MYTYFVGIDIAKYKHQAAFIGAAGDKAGPEISFDNTKDGFALFSIALNRFDKEQTVIGLESTGHYWLALYSFLLDDGWTVKVINPIQTDAFRKMNIRKTKTDRIDAVVIAELLRFGQYSETTLASEELIQLKMLSRLRTSLTETVGDFKRQIITILDHFFPEFSSCFSHVFGKTPTALLAEYPSPEELASCDLEKLIELLEKNSRGRHSLNKAVELKEKAANSIGVKRGADASRFALKSLLALIECVNEQIAAYDGRISEIMENYRIILSIPGVGPVTGGAIVGEIGDISRFKSPRQLVAYAGLDPKVTQSGQFTGTRNNISKRGSPHLRRALYIAANSARLFDPVFKAFYEQMVTRNKHHNQALNAVASKLARVIHAVLITQKPYSGEILGNTV